MRSVDERGHSLLASWAQVPGERWAPDTNCTKDYWATPILDEVSKKLHWNEKSYGEIGKLKAQFQIKLLRETRFVCYTLYWPTDQK